MGGAADRAAFRRHLLAEARARRCTGGLRRCPRSWSTTRPRLCWRRRGWRCVGGRVEAARRRCWTRRARVRERRRRAVRAIGGPGREPAGQRPRGDHDRCAPGSRGCAATPMARPRSHPAGPGRAGRGRLAADARFGPLEPGRGGVAARPARSTPSAASPPSLAALAGGRRASRLGSHAVCDLTSARSSAPGAAWTRRSATYQQALEIATAPGQPDLPVSRHRARGHGRGGQYQRDELDAALRHVTEGIALCRQLTYTPPLATGLARWRGSGRPGRCGRGAGGDRRGRAGRAEPGRDRPAQSRAGAAGAAAAGPGRRRRGRPLDPAARPQPRRRAELPARAGVSGAGAGAARARPPRRRRSRCWTGCSRRRPPRAGSAASSRSRRCGRWRWRPAATSPRAVDALAEALTLAGPRGYVRVFADEGAPMRALLGRSCRRPAGPSSPRPGRIAARLPGPGHAGASRQATPCRGSAPAAAAGVPGLIDPLTGRELEVLRLLAVGRSRTRPSPTSWSSPLDTVKKHVTHLFGKLGAANRTEAVARARQLGLIP